MQETGNICFGLKKQSMTLLQEKTDKHECRNATPTHVAVTFCHSCLPIFAWRRVVQHIFDPKQLLRVSCILWCYHSKCYPIILENDSLWCFIIIKLFYFLAIFDKSSFCYMVATGKKHVILMLTMIIKLIKMVRCWIWDRKLYYFNCSFQFKCLASRHQHETVLSSHLNVGIHWDRLYLTEKSI